ncbi:MAG: hypothetical protein H7A52_06370 [Akkermansiaceae bacterium]|nr:hypothetical protein [Akkermansiaceae bacterium]
MIDRRQFLQRGAFAVAGAGTAGRGFARESDDIAKYSEVLVPARAVTKGPKFHWFGYYDKLEFDPSNRFVLCNEVDFEGRTPTPEDRIRVGMVDLEDGDRWIELGKSDAWGWQQGCMLQWRPGSKNEVIWNDREDGRHVSRIRNVDTDETRTLPRPIYALSADGKWAVTADFARIQNLRPGYGYQGVADPFRADKNPEKSGIWRMNMDSGESELIVSLAALSEIPYQGRPLTDQWNYVNHLLVAPDSKRFIFLHRWRVKGPDDPEFAVNNGFVTRMFTANLDGSDLYVLDPSGFTSHFIWRDAAHVCAWTKPEGRESAFYLFRDKTDTVEIVGEGDMPVNGHNTYLPAGDGREWILNDTYPNGVRRQQTPYLYHVPTRRRHDLGHFHSPKEYVGEWRCDTHPRSSNDGKLVAIDSPHGGTGRQLWVLEAGGIVG